MTRENKLALIVGFSVILVVGVLVSDHFSKARQAQLRDLNEQEIGSVGVSRASEFIPTEPLVSDETTPIAARPATTAPAFTNTPWSDPRPSTGLINDALAASDRTTRDRSIPERESPVADRSFQDTPLLIEQGSPSLNDDAIALGGPRANNQNLINAGRDRGVNFVPLAQPASIAPYPARDTTRTTERSLQAEPALPTPWEYHVRENDSLYSIAQKQLGSGGRWQEIRDLNKDRLSNGSVLRIGLRLRMPADAKRPTSIDATPRPIADARTERREPTPRKASEYTVEPGDTLGQISQRLLGTVRRMDEIITLNSDKISDADEIRVGMTLRIPAS